MGMTPPEYFKKVGAQHPIGFIGEPIDLAYLDLYLASDESRWVTGAEFAKSGITVNAVCPGYILTPMVEQSARESNPARPQTVIDGGGTLPETFGAVGV